MKNQGNGSLKHYHRFVTKWNAIRKLKNEPITVVLSPHMDDVFLSLNSFICSGSIGRNIVGINVFTLTDSAVKTNVKSDFGTVSATSAMRMIEELSYSRYLKHKRINYVPLFMGFKDAAIDAYYRFIAGKSINGVSNKFGIRSAARAMHVKYVKELYGKLELEGALVPIIKQLGSIDKILAPMGIGDHIDHILLRNFSESLRLKSRAGLYADIPYIHEYGYDSIGKLKGALPKDYSTYEMKTFDPAEKTALFRKLYKSQYDVSIGKSMKAIAENTGEAIFWR
ncbi:MAG: hypothetical protein ACREBH_00250 [Candidatus Micrarchaeaceae archaeon]